MLEFSDIEKYDKVRERAEEIKQEYLTNYFQPLVTKAFKDLCEWLPHRKIELHWGMGTFVLEVERKCKHSATAIYDNYGSINDCDSMRNNMKESFLDSPLYKLAELLENCHCERGVYLYLKNMES